MSLKYQYWQLIHLFNLSDLLRSIPSEISILSYCRIFIIHTNNHLRKFVDNIYHLLQKSSNNDC